MKTLLALLTTLLLASPILAQETQSTQSTQPDKSAYSLINPTPRDQMREMNTDRPDKTESPYTVDAGHFQAVISFIDFTYSNPSPGNTTNTYKVLPSNLKVGLFDNVDFQFVFEPYDNQSSTNPPGPNNQAQGFGDIQLRGKINLWGNDQGSTAFGLMPFIQLPSGTGDLSNDHVEGGLIIPLAINITSVWDIGLMAQFNAVRNNTNTSYGGEFVHTLTNGFDLTDKLGLYLEYAGIYSVETGNNYQGTVDIGFTYGLTDNIQFDIGTNLGVTPAADAVNVFAGISIRY
jgi:hypothetical protein